MGEQIPDFDPYEELEVSRRASPATIDAAWRSLLEPNEADTVPR